MIEQYRDHDKQEMALYFIPRSAAFCLKSITQMTIGLLIFLVLCLKLALKIDDVFGNDTFLFMPNRARYFLERPSLDLVGQALALSAGVELAYMLFTPGPDEAVEPVILGLAASVLIIASDGEVNFKDYIAIPIYILSMGLLFVYREYFIRSKKK